MYLVMFHVFPKPSTTQGKYFIDLRIYLDAKNITFSKTTNNQLAVVFSTLNTKAEFDFCLEKASEHFTVKRN